MSEIAFMTWDAKEALIPEERWEKFVQHVKMLDRYISGSLTIDRESEFVRLDHMDSDSIAFARDMRGQAENGKVFVFTKPDRNFQVVPAISAMYLLFRQDCLSSNPFNCDNCGNFMDAQYGLARLREAGVWEEGEKCLITFEDIEDDLRRAIESARKTLREAWTETDTPDRTHIRYRIERDAIWHLPDIILNEPDSKMENNYVNWVNLVWHYADIDGYEKFGAVFTRKDGEITKEWFPDKNEAMNYAQQKMAELGLECKSKWNLPREFEGNGDAVMFVPLNFKDLPHDRIYERDREDIRAFRDPEENPYLRRMAEMKSLWESVRESREESLSPTA